jgi:antitoxin (DNA-binding transcriptional repressor) of toxin-antitoxin stability system
MKTITVRELHTNTGKWVQKAARHGQIFVTFNGKTVAKILPATSGAESEIPYFARRRYINPRLERLIASGRAGREGTDSTQGISEDREDRA